ncbi:TIGR01212 family radical SAM protein [Jeongeupia naejangsanensis]|uniref:TIGR01212 family radical SAM protein n=1 Tax=Jeongeupia naejangsanensis TaxID=613195 RepID=A0ABS2BJ44_9NEIS|nr:TIGR01212 family radical SAM protein [Jeongeupia naejangsanensis]MBM3115621.1 TIGR01212 family radical SAM protein [Jeongeupia naejangsanensis]
MNHDVPHRFGNHRYLRYHDLQAEQYGGRVQKVSLNAGFTCPNRDGTLGRRGCTFCNNAGFTPAYLHRLRGVQQQLDEGVARLRVRYPNTRHFFAYFQAYTNTYGELESLKAQYEAALAHPEVGGLVIGTRPDCLPDSLLDYFGELGQRVPVEIEIGIESCNDAALRRVKRGHDFAASVDAIRRVAVRGLPVTGHLLFGLPGETRESQLEAATTLSRLPLASLKLHQLQIIRGTAMARDWRRNPASLPLLGIADYVELVVDFLERLSPTIAIQRIGSEVPARLRLAPDDAIPLSALQPRIAARLAERQTWQGRLFGG